MELMRILLAVLLCPIVVFGAGRRKERIEMNQLDDTCVLAWSFAEGQGARDWSAQNTGITANSATYTPAGNVFAQGTSDGSYYFSTTSSNLIQTAAKPALNGPLTIIVWYWNTSSTGTRLYYTFLCQQTSDASDQAFMTGLRLHDGISPPYRYMLYWYNGYSYGTESAAAAGFPANNAQWHMVAHTRTAANAYFFSVDLVTMGSGSSPGGGDLSVATSYFAGSLPTGGQGMTGGLTKVMVFSRVLTANEIREIYHRGRLLL